MRFLLDENVDYRLVRFLTKRGYNVISILQRYKPGQPDEKVLETASTEKRILITNDKDYGALIFLRHLPHNGVILFRLKDESLENVQTRLQLVLTDYKDQLRYFLVLTQKSVRVRRQIENLVA